MRPILPISSVDLVQYCFIHLCGIFTCFHLLCFFSMDRQCAIKEHYLILSYLILSLFMRLPMSNCINSVYFLNFINRCTPYTRHSRLPMTGLILGFIFKKLRLTLMTPFFRTWLPLSPFLYESTLIDLYLCHCDVLYFTLHWV